VSCDISAEVTIPFLELLNLINIHLTLTYEILAMNVSMHKSLTCVQQIIGYNFADTNILWEALQAAGSDVYLIKTRRISSDGNKKMALIGDALAKAAVLESWWRKNESRGKQNR
jgi:hypothetical protein